MNNIRTAKTMFLAGMIATAAPMGAAAGEAQQDLQQEIVEQGNTALEAMSIHLVHDMNWSKRMAEQTFSTETSTATKCPRKTVTMEQHTNHGENPQAIPGDFRTAGITNP